MLLLKWEEGVERRRGEEQKEEWGVRGREGRKTEEAREEKKEEGGEDRQNDRDRNIYIQSKRRVEE